MSGLITEKIKILHYKLVWGNNVYLPTRNRNNKHQSNQNYSKSIKLKTEEHEIIKSPSKQ